MKAICFHLQMTPPLVPDPQLIKINTEELEGKLYQNKFDPESKEYKYSCAANS